MGEFEIYVKKGDVVETSIDRELAKGLLRIAVQRAENLFPDSQITDKNSFQVVENSYEAVKELIDALMALNGFKSYSHEASIIFLSEYYKVPAHIINAIDRYRKIRNDIKYRGILTTSAQGKTAKRDLKNAFDLVKALLKKEL